MEVSDQYRSSHHALPSPDNTFIASLHESRLQIRSTTTLEVIHSIAIPQENNPRFICMRWSPKTEQNPSCNRLLVADEDYIRVWDLRDRKWNATISNGSGGMGKMINADFGGSENEVLLFSDFGAKVAVWSLSSGRSVEIKDPKFSTSRGFGYRNKTGIFALLSRPNAQDTLTLHAPDTYFVIKTVVPPTNDAQGLKWSPDGNWFALWDTPSVGHRVYIYTADGHLYRMYGGAPEGDLEGLGVRNMEWSPRGDYLAISGYDKRVTLLSTKTFSPAVFLDHTSSIQLSSGSVWEEQAAASGERTYGEIAQPFSPPAAPSVPGEALTKLGISTAVFNVDGTLIATKDETTPTTVWIWDLSNLAPKAVVVQHSPVKQLSWHPTDQSLLMIQSLHEEPMVYLWKPLDAAPEAIPIKFKKAGGKLEAKWFNTARDRKPALIFGDTHGHVLCWPHGRDTILRFEHPESPERADDSEDSLFEILSGRKPVPRPDLMDDTEDLDDTSRLEDTFRNRKPAMNSTMDGTMDESFF